MATLYRLDGKVDAVLKQLERLEDLEGRVRNIERRQSMVAGAGALGGGLISALIALAGVLPK